MIYELNRHVPLSNFDLYAIGIVLVVVLCILAFRRIWRWKNDTRRNHHDQGRDHAE